MLASLFHSALQPLYSYLKGNNEAKLHIDMAKPAITQIHPDKDYSSTGTNYTVLFYLPGLSEVGSFNPFLMFQPIVFGALKGIQCSLPERQRCCNFGSACDICILLMQMQPQASAVMKMPVGSSC